MVKICNTTYENQDSYNQYFENYPYPLSSFQKYAIEAIVEKHHILITAHTGSGKTLPAEFAIEHLVAQKKKVIYTSPIKALSNQKFYEFTKKFPHISFGILTGDIKTNPEADVLIMTTEILLNTLYSKKNTLETKPSNSVNSFQMDIDSELGCVIFDEVHYINDASRGKIWEETIMLLPQHVQMVMLSATLDAPEKFASWCESRHPDSNKIVYLASTYERVVPLTHYSFITCNSGVFKAIKDKTIEAEIKKVTNKLHVIQNEKGIFQDTNYQTIHKTMQYFSKSPPVKRGQVLNQVSKFMVENNMLPALCFVLSRKALETSADEITTVLFEDDSKVPYTVRHECEQIIRKLPNFQEYLHLPEYHHMVQLLEKGVAIHHAGVMPVLREMVEILFGRGYIKLLFATETFAVGINMPTKTVLFTDVNKFDGTEVRPLYSHEYTQMAGRAGRRGIDTVGSVIHLNNLFKPITSIDYRKMLLGTPQKLISKFKISYHLLLNLVRIGDQEFSAFAKGSMIQTDITKQLTYLSENISKTTDELEKIDTVIRHLRTPRVIMQRYLELVEENKTAINKQRKQVTRELDKIKEEFKTIAQDSIHLVSYNNKNAESKQFRLEYKSSEQYIQSNVIVVLDILKEYGFVGRDTNNNNIVLTPKGIIASQLRETHCLVFAEMVPKIQSLDVFGIVSLLSIFTNITVSDEKKVQRPSQHNIHLPSAIVEEVVLLKNKYLDEETRNRINTGTECEIQYDLIDYILDWCHCETIEDCKRVIQRLEQEKDVFLGEFVKAILKIVNIAYELESVAENDGNMEFLHKLKQIPQLTMKYIATNQSLYI